MLGRRIGVKAILLGAAFLGSVTAASAQTATAARPAAVSPVLVQKRQAVQNVSADAMAVLSALQRDPMLAGKLADNPNGAQALLRGRGATRAEQIIVRPTGEGAARTITITLNDYRPKPVGSGR